MRPLNKGNTPTDPNGNLISPTDYQSWRKVLIERIGYYCAFCNQPLSHSLQVEHVIPKNPRPGYIAGAPLAWDNMLLACGPCNNKKGNQPITTTLYYLPEEHNSHLPFTTESTNDQKHTIVVHRPNLNAGQEIKAKETIRLLALNEIDTRDKIVDIRSEKRRDALNAIASARLMLDACIVSPMYNPIFAGELVSRIAKSVGFFSLWYEEFADQPEVMRQLIDGTIIKGTAQDCFDSGNGYQPIPRNPNNNVDPI